MAERVIGNPPFLGGWRLIAHLGEDYTSRIRATYAGRVIAGADLVCWWFEKAGRQIESGRAARAGLVGTNSIRGGANRQALEAATTGLRIFEAWSDEAWVVDGAAVRVSLICFSHRRDRWAETVRLDGETVDQIHSDLSGRSAGAGVDLTRVRRLSKNAGAAFMGASKKARWTFRGSSHASGSRCPPTRTGGRMPTF